MNKVLNAAAIILVGGVLASCTQATSGASFSQYSNITESFISESFISETVISENVISEEVIEEELISEETTSEEVIEEEPVVDLDLGIWLEAYDIMREPTAEERLLAPEVTVTPGRYTYEGDWDNPGYLTSFDYMEEGSFNGFNSSNVDPNLRGYAFIMYHNGEFYMASGVGIGLMMYSGYANSVEKAQEVITVDIYINYSITDYNTLDVNDIVTIHVTTFTFQYALLSEVQQ
jgi:hypothetical protein